MGKLQFDTETTELKPIRYDVIFRGIELRNLREAILVILSHADLEHLETLLAGRSSPLKALRIYCFLDGKLSYR